MAVGPAQQDCVSPTYPLDDTATVQKDKTTADDSVRLLSAVSCAIGQQAFSIAQCS